MDPVQQLREKAQQCRRLAFASTDTRAIEALTLMAKEYETAAEAAAPDQVLEPRQRTRP